MQCKKNTLRKINKSVSNPLILFLWTLLYVRCSLILMQQRNNINYSQSHYDTLLITSRPAPRSGVSPVRVNNGDEEEKNPVIIIQMHTLGCSFNKVANLGHFIHSHFYHNSLIHTHTFTLTVWIPVATPTEFWIRELGLWVELLGFKLYRYFAFFRWIGGLLISSKIFYKTNSLLVCWGSVSVSWYSL